MFFDFLRLIVRWGWPLRVMSPLFGRWRPYDRSYLRDPYPSYQRLREQAPVYRHPLFRAFILSRHADIDAALKDARFSVRRGDGGLPEFMNPFGRLSPDFMRTIESSLLMLDPPDHTRIRNLVNRAFTPRVVQRLTPRIESLVDEIAGELGDRAAGGGEIDLVADFAVPVPLLVIAEMLGVPSEDRERFKRWSSGLAGLLDPVNAEASLPELEGVFFEMRDWFEQLFEARRREPRDDLVSQLVAIEEAGDRLDAHELLGVVALILGAGHETTTNLISNAVVTLLRHPEERKRLQEDPGLIATAVDEFLRFESPVQATDRVALEDVEVGGQRIRKGQFVLMLLGSANRDPAVFDEPERLDLARSPNRHLSFGQGVHFCLGAQLARLEARIAIATLLRRFPDLRGDPEPPGWRASVVLRGPTALPLSL